jgi:hypothetical protein
MGIDRKVVFVTLAWNFGRNMLGRLLMLVALVELVVSKSVVEVVVVVVGLGMNKSVFVAVTVGVAMANNSTVQQSRVRWD